MGGQNKKKILIIHSNLELGGAETSLLGLMDGFDYDNYDVDLFLLSHSGELMRGINPNVNLLKESLKYKALTISIATCFRTGNFSIAFARLFAKILMKTRKYSNCEKGYTYKQLFHKMSLPFLPKFEKEYDLVLSFIDPHFIAANKVKAKAKLGWVHFECLNKTFCYPLENEMWSSLDQAICVSEKSMDSFITSHKEYSIRACVIENLLSKYYVVNKSTEPIDTEMKADTINLLSIGRYTKQKNFDNIPAICSYIVQKNPKCRWYIIGFGSDEALIKEKIKQNKMEQHVILLGKKENPYPYIKACDVYIQPSRWEGKSVAVREAQMLEKPVIITDFPSAESQLVDGYDGLIVPMDNEKCAQEILALVSDSKRKQLFISHCKSNDYTNSSEMEKIYNFI